MAEQLVMFAVLMAFLLGFLLGVSTTNEYYKDQAIKYDCAHYDPITAKFTWNKE